jgi:hypothetical protein
MLLPNELPAPHQLLAQPELAALAVLDVALEIVQGAIVAAHPGWVRCKCSIHPYSERCAQAGMIGCMAYELQEAVGEYLRDRPSDPDE